MDLLLDVMDLRLRIGQPLDFREYLPQIAWVGKSSEPGEFSDGDGERFTVLF